VAKKSVLLAVGWALVSLPAFGADPPKVQWTSGPGVVSLGDQAELSLKAGQAFANAKDAQTLMEAMGNTISGHEVGLVRPLAEHEDWLLVFEHHDVGFVKDDEKNSIDKDALFKSISEGTEEGNKRRKELGISALHVVGWFEEPHYDVTTHNLVWALKAKDDGGGEVVNYNMRILGRTGYMSVVLIDEPAKLPTSKPIADRIMNGFSYKSGNKYAEFRSGDRLAEYGLTALIAGGAGAAAAKLGLFAALWKILAKGGKAVVVLVVGAIAGLKRMISSLFNRNKET
jgi:uncharacterized membrane-anchored protein